MRKRRRRKHSNDGTTQNNVRRPLHRSLVRILTNARRHVGMTQGEAAEKLDRSQTWMARVEAGQRRIDVEEFVDFAELYGFEPKKLLAVLLR